MSTADRSEGDRVLGNLSAAGHTGAINVGAYRHVFLTLVGHTSAAFDVLIQTTLLDDEPDFTAAAALDNEWAYMGSFDLNDPSSVVAGATGYSFAANGVKQIIVNTDKVEWLAVEVANYTSGNLRAYVSYAE